VAESLRVAGGDRLVFEVTGEVLAAVRKTKSEQKVSLMTPVRQVIVHDTPERLAALRRAESDLCEAGKIAKLSTEIGTELRVEVELAPPDDA
jgi:valyl-tRNA synthetase